MAVVTPSRRHASHHQHRRRASAKIRPSVVGALIVFALMAALGPLAFGAVDPLIQIGLVALLTFGVALYPPELPVLSRRSLWLLTAFVALLVLKEFAPAALFGRTHWRTTVVESYGLALPFTHHPEPGRALDALLAAVVAAVWFFWVRTLAGPGGQRIAVIWTLFVAAALVAGVSFALRSLDHNEAIFGLRYTPGWLGFGPFPNRNHSGCFFALGSILGCGCIAWAAAGKKYFHLPIGLGLLGLTIAALLATQSRGGLIAFGVGVVVLLALACVKSHHRRVWVAAIVFVAIFALAAALFGGPVIARFSSPASDVSNSTRMELWREAVTVWRDAPLFGHGAGSFSSIFPLYQTIELDNQRVIHPESSWLLWLDELGLIAVLIGSLAFAAYLIPAFRGAFARQRSFFPIASGLAAAIALLVHSAIDVPAHRWGTAGFALAALALAYPRPRSKSDPASAKQPSPDQPSPAQPPLDLAKATHSAPRWVALIPLAIAAFWALPLWVGWPPFSPFFEALLLARAQTTTTVSTPELEQSLAYFPLDPSLHLAAGWRELQTSGAPDRRWRQHFQIASRLEPGSWGLPEAQARACGRQAPGYALNYWQLAIDRSGWRAPELFQTALKETSGFPGAAATWAGFAEARPALLLPFAQTLPDAEGRLVYERWWRVRGAPPQTSYTAAEIDAFYGLAKKWGAAHQLKTWMSHEAGRADHDFRRWAALFHAWGDDEAAWDLLALHISDPALPSDLPAVSRPLLEKRWRTTPEDYLNAQSYAAKLLQGNELDAARQVVSVTAARDDAPEWFVLKAAYLLKAHGEASRAVALLLQPKKPR